MQCKMQNPNVVEEKRTAIEKKLEKRLLELTKKYRIHQTLTCFLSALHSSGYGFYRFAFTFIFNIISFIFLFSIFVFSMLSQLWRLPDVGVSFSYSSKRLCKHFDSHVLFMYRLVLFAWDLLIWAWASLQISFHQAAFFVSWVAKGLFFLFLSSGNPLWSITVYSV